LPTEAVVAYQPIKNESDKRREVKVAEYWLIDYDILLYFALA